jgi:GPH family glycoside/pentoside/hexuronide:cation symporter
MKLDEHHKTAEADRVSFSRLIAFGMGGLIPIALFNIAGQLMGLMGNISMGLSAFWLGTIMIIPRLWDAFTDPMMGHISDNARTRWGRRRPFILVGAIAVAISFVAMWWGPQTESIGQSGLSEAASLLYILLLLLVFYTACTVFEIPHGALGMEMSGDTHERTRLFSAKSFLGNLFAMGTPWLFWLANRELFKGTGGNEHDGMRWVSMVIAAVLIPMAFWWFAASGERTPASAAERVSFKDNLKNTFQNRLFIVLVVIFFVLAMGFNFVALLNYYISIFYLFAGDKEAASVLLGINGTVWAVTGLLAVFPLNWLDRRLGKRNTLIFAILLMCGAQLSKRVCYNPEHPYLVLIPTVLLSAGMLMFFTLGPSMLGDICDENELKTGRRSDGSYYAVFWWFIKMGTAFASFVTGVLIVVSQFDETQTVGVDKLKGSLAVVQAEVVDGQPVGEHHFEATYKIIGELRSHFETRESSGHMESVLGELESLEQRIRRLERGTAVDGEAVVEELERLVKASLAVAAQAPSTLLKLRVIEILLPLLLSSVSLFLTFRYPLTEQRIYEIKSELDRRREAVENG